jgi:hypothetical protein
MNNTVAWILVLLMAAFILMLSLGAIGAQVGFLPILGLLVGTRLANIVVTGVVQ